MKSSQSQKRILFAGLFAILGFILLQIKFTRLAGSSVSFTLFDFFAPVAGAFLGGFLGIISVLLVSLTNFFLSGAPLETASIIRLFPTLFAVFYFGLDPKKRENNLILLVPAAAIVLFIVHPIGRSVWYYSLFWLIPILSYFKRDNLLIRSLGATFTAHAVGGAAWLWAFNLPSGVWKSLIPVVVEERTAFTLGIAASYVILNSILNKLIAMGVIRPFLKIDKRYIIFS